MTETASLSQGILATKRDIVWTSHDGLKLYAAHYGPQDSKVTVLCMHGLTRNHKDFEPMIEGLGMDMRFVSVDVRGRGKSDRDPSGKSYAPPVYVQDMATLTAHLNLDELILIGTSMGGLMAMLMAKAFPEKIKGIVMNDVGPEVNPAGLKRIAGYAGGNETFDSWGDAAAAIGRTQAGVYPDYGEEAWMEFARRTCVERDDGKIGFDYDPVIVQGMGSTSPGWRVNFAMWRVFATLKSIPLLIIRGETSDILTKKTAKRMLRRHKTSQLLTVPERGHTPFLDEPVSLHAIGKFLTRLSQPAG
jgi:pimeloyl-ACP methyl ester carboxylesterase